MLSSKLFPKYESITAIFYSWCMWYKKYKIILVQLCEKAPYILILSDHPLLVHIPVQALAQNNLLDSQNVVGLVLGLLKV